MILIINTTTLSGTGVTQVAISFINECKAYGQNVYHIFLSKTVETEIDINNFPKNFFFYKFENHPLYGIAGHETRVKLKKLEAIISPDIIFTVFGPSCWTPKALHVSGFANSYYVYPESPFFKKISTYHYLRIILMKIGHRFFLKRNGNFFICETNDMSERLSKFLHLERKNIFTVSNTYSEYYDKPLNIGNTILPVPENNEFRLLSLASFDVHKNLTIINDVVKILKTLKLNVNLKFVLTIRPDKFDKSFSEEAKSMIINVGRVKVKDCPQLYSECDALFLPTLIESFSANYPEAMKMQIPILTSNYSFAKSICADSAVYFDPLNPTDITEKIIKVINDKEFVKKLITNGTKRLHVFGNAEFRAKKYLEVFQQIINSKKN